MISQVENCSPIGKLWSKSVRLFCHLVQSIVISVSSIHLPVSQWLKFQLLRTGTMMNTPVPCQTRKSSRPVEVPPRLLENLSTVLLVIRLLEVITRFPLYVDSAVAALIAECSPTDNFMDGVNVPLQVLGRALWPTTVSPTASQ